MEREAEDLLLTQDLDSTVNWFLRYRRKMRTQAGNLLFSAGAYISQPGMSNEKNYENKNIWKYKYEIKANTFLLYNQPF